MYIVNVQCTSPFQVLVCHQPPLSISGPCDAASLTTVTDGTWAPSTGTVRHMDVATLSCGATSFMQGDGKALCQDSKFEDLSPEPTCETTSELTCGPLISPVNGAVVYTDSNTASYICDVGYALFGTTQVRRLFNVLQCHGTESTYREHVGTWLHLLHLNTGCSCNHRALYIVPPARLHLLVLGYNGRII